MKMREYCEDIKILPWYDDRETLEEIKLPDKIPETITKLQKYFPGARPYDSGGKVFSKVNLGFPIRTDRETFEKDFGQWCRDQPIRFYKTAVQHSNVKTSCWLPYMPRSTDVVLLSTIFSKAYQATMGESVPIGLVWRNLNGQQDVPIKQRLQAIHVECPKDKTASVKKFLRMCSHQKKYPGGARFRVMSEYWPYMTDKNKERYRYMADKHRYFLEKKWSVWELTNSSTRQETSKHRRHTKERYT